MDGRQELETLGRLWLRNLLSPAEAAALAQHCGVGARPGVRLGLHPELARCVGPASTLSRRVAKLGVDPAPVRLVAFNKSPHANWAVPWHQDRVIAVAEKHETPGYSNWVEKGVFWHCEPPIEALRQMVFVRIHLDRCDEKNGALE